jgi:NAD(P)-dependent dehydrogenase (short-subunit alcohol dehydrogenase family)
MSAIAQRVMVSAAGRSIGRAVAERFHAAGAKVHICCLTTESLETVRAANAGITGSIADVGVAHEVERWFGEGLDALGGLDVLVNNAGIGGPRAPIEEISDVDWHRTVDVNLHSMFYCIKRAVPLMRSQGSGAIINISTASTRVGMPLRSPYIATKCAVDGLTENLARELGPFGIRCNAILPGLVDNPRGRALITRLASERNQTIADAEERYLSYNSMRTFVTSEEVADTAFFLASDAGRHISGQLLGVCGNLEWEE